MRSAESIKQSLWMKLTASLANRFDVTAQTIRRLIPKYSQLVQYGRVYQLEGGDVMQAHELKHPQSDSRDMSFVWVCADVYF
jgi:DeoR/GlpR family transcriptional regulator of sugar metabolism